LALPTEALLRPGEDTEVSLLPASLLRLRCQGDGGKGAYVLGEASLFLSCGGEAVLPPGSYRLLPQAEAGFQGEEKRVELPPLEAVEAVLAFAPVPVATLSPPKEGVRLLLPGPVAPGEEVELALEGEEPVRLSVREGDVLVYSGEGRGPFRFQVPWDASGPLLVELEGKGWKEARLLPVDVSRELLLVRLTPGRASLGDAVEVAVSARFPAEGVELLLPDGRRLPFSQKGEREYTLRLVVDEGLLEGAEPLGGLLGVRLRVVAWQGERRVERGVRLLVRR
jgi:hypothetical protein